MKNLDEKFLEKAVVLDWHVDTWDILGWKDTSATKESKKRMQRYLGAQSAPPALFIANRRIAPPRLKQSVDDEAARKPTFAIDGSAARKEDRIEAAVKVRKLDAAKEPDEGVKVIAVLYRRSKTLTPTSGHNQNRKLVEPFVVLRAKVHPLEEALSDKGITASFEAPQDADSAELGVAVLVEELKGPKTFECRAFPVAAKGH